MSVTMLAFSELGTFIASILMSLIMVGVGFGKVLAKMEFMSDRLAKIEGMFTLRLKDDRKE